MGAAPANLEETIFAAAVGLTAEQRETYLRSACGDDTSLLERIRKLLDAHGVAESFMDRSPISGWSRETNEPSPGIPFDGETIGRYKLAEKLGEGGCGIVYRAEQTYPIRRTVALKIIKLGMDTENFIARFEAERQALAMMEHPNIARVFDAGATETGRPYFVMELVRGQRITDYCDQQNLSTGQRLGMFVQVCNAIQHAHQKGIIHRDIKPSNIVVAVQDDGAAVPVVIDFGIAKAAQGKLTDQTYHTALEQFIGTPAYMSPEQAEVNAKDIDTRSDIYSLGVLLYELLTGRTPFDPKELAHEGFEGMRQRIRNDEPKRPSTYLHLLKEDLLSATARQRGIDGMKLIRLVRGDLDWIVMKCLEKDRARRYETASALAADVQRYLNNEPITARAPSRLYRFRKVIRRNKLAFASAAAVLLVLLLGIFFSGREAIRANRAERELRRNLYLAQMSLAGEAAAAPAGMTQVAAYLSAWQNSKPDLRSWEWYYLNGLCHMDLLTLRGHSGAVRWAAWRPDGSRVASAGSDGTIKIWDATDGRQLRTINCGAVLNMVAWSTDGSLLAAVDQNGVARVCDPETGSVTREIRAHQGAATALSWSPKDQQFATAGADGFVRCWDAKTGDPVHRFEGLTALVATVSWSPDGSRIAASAQGRVNGVFRPTTVWDVRSGQTLLTIPEDATCIEWSPDGKSLARGGANWFVHVYDAATGKLTLDVSHDGHVLSVAGSPDAAQIASVGRSDGTVKVWDVASGRLAYRVQGHQSQINSVSWNSKGTRLVTASEDGTIRIWESPAPDSARTQPVVMGGIPRMDDSGKDSNWVESVVWHPNGSLLASGGRDLLVRLWDPDTFKQVGVLEGHTGWVYSVAFSPDGKRLASTGVDKSVRVWDVQARRQLMVAQEHTMEGRSVSWTPDGKRLASCANDALVKIWDPDSGECLRTLTGHTEGARSVAWSPDGSRLASTGFDRTVRIWDAGTGAELKRLNGHTNWVESVRWSPDGKRLASAGLDQTIKIWDLASGAELMTLRGHTNWIRGLSWSPDGARLASACLDATIKLWDTQTGVLAMTLPEASFMGAVAWSPDGIRLAASGRLGHMVLHDATVGFKTAAAASGIPSGQPER